MKKKAKFYPVRIDRYLERNHFGRLGSGPRAVIVCPKCYHTNDCKCNVSRVMVVCLGAIPRHTAKNRWKKLIAEHGRHFA